MVNDRNRLLGLYGLAVERVELDADTDSHGAPVHR
jgi:hypothetical protein